MLIFLLIFLLVSNALTTRRDKSILFSRIVIKSLLMISFIAHNNMYLNPLGGYNVEKIKFTSNSILIYISLTSIIGIPTLLFLLFIYIPGEWFNIVSILTLIIFIT